MTFAYVASPYSPVNVADPDEQRDIREQRFTMACWATAQLMKRGVVAFSPIAHSHAIERHFDTPESGEFWKRQDEPYLMACERLIVLTMDGWGLSTGVAHEIAVAAARGIPIEYVTLESLEAA